MLKSLINFMPVLLCISASSTFANEYFWVLECKGDIPKAKLVPSWLYGEQVGAYYYEQDIDSINNNIRKRQKLIIEDPSSKKMHEAYIKSVLKNKKRYTKLLKVENNSIKEYETSKNICLHSRHREEMRSHFKYMNWFCKSCGDRLIYLLQGKNGKLEHGKYKFIAKVHLNEFILKETRDFVNCDSLKKTKVVKDVVIEKDITKDQKNVYFELDKKIFGKLKVHCDGAKVEIKVLKDNNIIHKEIKDIPHWPHSS